jgi:hypothetical protein
MKELEKEILDKPFRKSFTKTRKLKCGIATCNKKPYAIIIFNETCFENGQIFDVDVRAYCKEDYKEMLQRFKRKEILDVLII